MEPMVKQGLKENRYQFILLVIINAFVGGMIGMERNIFPKFASEVFGIDSHIAILSFIVAFGFSKALMNYFTGKLANEFGRKKLLVWGWAIAIPIPFMLMYATNWNEVIVANILLGISQGLTWSSTVVMKIDLVGEKNRGLAMGLNEFAGYLAVGLIAFFTGYLADRFGVTPYPFYIGIVISITGFLLSWFGVEDTRKFVQIETASHPAATLQNILKETTYKHKTLSTVTQAGLINNLNDGMIWGLLPILLMTFQYNTTTIGLITSVYPMVWGIGQLLTGKMSDQFSKKSMLFVGMLIQGIAILLIPFTTSFYFLVFLATILGLGTALVYPTFLSTIAQVVHPSQRAESLGIFRFWRDLGYAVGALLAGITADIFGLSQAIVLIGGLTLISSLIVQFRMDNI